MVSQAAAGNGPAAGLFVANGEEGEQPAAAFRHGASQLADVLTANGMSDEATGSVMPNYLRVLLDEVGEAAVEAERTANGRLPEDQ